MNIFGHNERKFIPEPVVVSINDMTLSQVFRVTNVEF